MMARIDSHVATQSDIRATSDQIVAEFRPQRVILFGSYARGTAGRDSDIDILVVLPVDGPRYRLAARIRASLTPSMPIDVLVRAPSDVATIDRRSDLVLSEALREGVVLYSAAA